MLVAGLRARARHPPRARPVRALELAGLVAAPRRAARAAADESAPSVDELDGAAEEVHGGGDVRPTGAPHAPPPRAARQRAFAHRAGSGAPSSRAVADRPARGGSRRSRPGASSPSLATSQSAKLLVQRRPLALRDRLVRRVADEDVAEAERRRRPAAVARSGRISSLRTSVSRCAPTSARSALGQERCDRRRGGRAVLRPSRAATTARSGSAEAVDAGGEQRLQRRRHLELAVAALGLHGDELLDEERVALRSLDDPLARLVAAGRRAAPRAPRCRPPRAARA